MAVGDTYEMWSGEGGSYSTPDGRKRQATLRRAFTVDCEVTDNVEDILAATDIPELDDLYPNMTHIRCVDLQPKKLSPILWQVDAVYRGESGPSDITASAVNEKPERVWSSVESNEEIDEALASDLANGPVPIATVNGEPLHGVTADIYDIKLTVNRNFLTVNLPAIHQYLRSTNSDVFAGFAPGTARLKSFVATQVADETVPGGHYFHVNAVVVFRYPYQTQPARAWWSRVRHEGYMVKIPNLGIFNATTDSGDVPVNPTLLKVTGEKETDPTNAYWREFQLYYPLPYSPLGLL